MYINIYQTAVVDSRYQQSMTTPGADGAPKLIRDDLGNNTPTKK